MLGSMTLNQLGTFVAVAESGSFRAGAARLSRVQSAVSHAIANLEAELGVALFDRSGHRPLLTPEGRTLLADARAILLKIDTMRARASGMGHGVELELRIEVDTLFSLDVVAAALCALNDLYPSVSVRLSVSALGGPIVALDRRTADVGIVLSPIFSNPRIELEALSFVSLVAVVGMGHPLASAVSDGATIASHDLADHLQVVLEDPTLLSVGRDFGVLSPGIWRVNSQDAKRALIVAGLGWGRLPSWVVERDLAEGRLIRVPALALGLEGEAILDVYLAHRTDEPMGPAATAFRDALRRVIADDADRGPPTSGGPPRSGPLRIGS